jgi:RimJ/RimL family protein N-acetyltransferase
MTVILSLWENPGMDFDLQPNLKGALVVLRPLVAEDFDAVYSAASDPRIWEQHPEPFRYRREVFQKFFDGAIASKGAFAVLDIASGRVIGSSRYYDYSPAHREVKIGYTFVSREFWGAGYNPEMKKLMLDHAFRYVDRVFFEIGETNIRSQMAIQRIGATLVGKADLPGLDGGMRKMLVYSITRNRIKMT